MKIHDISLPISENLVVWPGDPPVTFSFPRHLGRGDHCTVGEMTLSHHTGTHVDAPAHFLKHGSTVENLDLDILIGPALVVDCGKASVLTAAVLAGLNIQPESERLLFKTRNSAIWGRGEKEFIRDFTAITPDGAEWLTDRRVRLVGIDYLSVAPFGNDAATHETLLQAGVILLEGLDLSGIAAGRYQLICLPLRLVGAEGSPVRAVLIEEERDVP
jgi:arylformamidase